MRAYHRTDPLMDERKSHYSPAQFGAFMKLQLVAGRQANPGYFRSIAAAKAALPTAYAKLLPFLVAQGDLVTVESGEAYVDGFTEWQLGDLTVTERMRRLRDRKRHPAVTDTVTSDVSNPRPQPYRAAIGVGVGSSVGSLTGETRATEPEKPDVPESLFTTGWNASNNPDVPPLTAVIDYLEERTGGSWHGRPGQLVWDTLEADIRNFGVDTILAEYRAWPGKRQNFSQIVLGVTDRLHPLAKAHEAEREARQDEEAARFNRSVERTQREIARTRGEA